MAWEAEERAEAPKAKAWVAEEKVASVGTQAFEGYKKSAKFRDEVGEATYDAFLKGFAKCKGKVYQAFLDLDLKSIMDEELEQQEDEEEEAKEVEVAPVVKIKKVEIEKTREIKVIEDVSRADIRVTKKVDIGIREVAGPIKKVTTTRTEGVASVSEVVSKVMAEMKAIISVAIEAFKASSTLVANPKK